MPGAAAALGREPAPVGAAFFARHLASHGRKRVLYCAQAMTMQRGLNLAVRALGGTPPFFFVLRLFVYRPADRLGALLRRASE